MKKRYTLEVLTYDGRVLQRTIEADNIQMEAGTIQFLSDVVDRWIPIAVYPSDKTIITKIENLK